MTGVALPGDVRQTAVERRERAAVARLHAHRQRQRVLHPAPQVRRRVEIIKAHRQVPDEVVAHLVGVELAHELRDRFTGHAEVQHRAQCVDVRRRLRRQSLKLLRGRILRGADERAHAGQSVTDAAHDLGDAEVRDFQIGDGLGADLLDQQHVLGLEIAVHHVLAVRDLERPAHLPPDVRGDRDRQRADLSDVVEQAAAGLKAGDEVGRVAGAVYKAAALDDLGVVQALKDLRLGRQAAKVGTLIALLVEHFYREQRAHFVAAGSDLAGEVGHPGAADREPLADSVGAINGLAFFHQLAPAGLRAYGAARQVGTAIDVLCERRQASAAIASSLRHPPGLSCSPLDAAPAGNFGHLRPCLLS